MASLTSAPSLVAVDSPAAPQGVAAFITKVWKILENQDYQRLISWSECGKNVIIHDYPNFSKEILPRYFKHNNFNSFVRQLNLYGFRKVSHLEQGVLSKVQVNEPIEFWHPNFRRGHPELLSLVQRRPVSSRHSTEEKVPELNKVLTDIHQMKGKQENIGDMLKAMKQDNDHLRRELGLLKERHTRQQRVLNKIIQFLVHMVYKGRLPSSNRRPDPRYLMLTDSEAAPSPKRARVALDSSPPPLTFSDISTLPMLIESPPIVEPINSVPPFSSSSISTTSTTSSPSNHVTSLDPTTLLEPAVATSVIPISTMSPLSSEPSTALPTITSPSISTAPTPPTSYPSLLSPITSYAPLALPALPDPAAQSTAEIEGDLPSDFNSATEWHHLTGHMDNHQQELDSLPNFLSHQLSVDPSVLNQFITLGNPLVPDYDAIDIARLLETVSGEDNGQLEMLREDSPQTALIPVALSLPHSTSPQPSDIDEPSSSLRELLELKDTFPET